MSKMEHNYLIWVLSHQISTYFSSYMHFTAKDLLLNKKVLDAGFLWPHCLSGMFGRPFLPHNFWGNKSIKLTYLQHFCHFRKSSGPKLLILIQLLRTGMTQNLESLDCILTKCEQWWPFLKRPELRRSGRNPVTNNQPRRHSRMVQLCLSPSASRKMNCHEC